MSHSFDFTQTASYILCPRQWYYRHYLNLVPNRVSPALSFGQAIHSALDALYQNQFSLEVALEVWMKQEIDQDDLLRTRETGVRMLTNYYKQYKDIPNFTPLHNEIYWNIPVSEEISLCGRIDRIVQWGDRPYILEHKTTSRLGATYFESFNPNYQPCLYIIAAREYVPTVYGAIIDAIFVGKTDKCQRDILRIPDQELDERIYEFICWCEQIVETRKLLDAHPHEPDNLPDEVRALVRRVAVQEICAAWSGCAYRDLCRFGCGEMQLSQYKVEKWEPNTKVITTPE